MKRLIIVARGVNASAPNGDLCISIRRNPIIIQIL